MVGCAHISDEGLSALRSYTGFDGGGGGDAIGEVTLSTSTLRVLHGHSNWESASA